MILGLTGLIGSGKGVVASILAEKGFEVLGHSGIIREEVTKRGLPVTRENLVKVGNDLRKNQGNDVLARLIFSNIKPGKNYVVEGFRSLGEIEAFRKLPNFLLLGIATGKKRRFDWIVGRAKPGDPQTQEEFEEREGKDFLQAIPEGQQNALCFASADFYITNEGSLEDLRKEVEEILSLLHYNNC